MKRYLDEFPDFDTELYVPEGWEDCSWHNDEMPRAVLIIEMPFQMPFGEVQYCLWQDYVDVDKRERGDFHKRIAFYIYVNGEVVFTYETDDLEKAKEVIKGVMI